MSEKKIKLTLNEKRTFFIYEGEDKQLKKVANNPHLDVEDHIDWKSYKTNKENPNLIGQIRKRQGKAVFHLCFNPTGRILDREMMEAIMKGMDYIDNS